MLSPIGRGGDTESRLPAESVFQAGVGHGQPGMDRLQVAIHSVRAEQEVDDE
jgi:hypothetical protein